MKLSELRSQTWRGLGLLLIGALSLPSMSSARTWPIQKDDNIPSDQIGTVVQGAASGDTVLVGPGTYYEHIFADDKSMTFLSTDGASVTILDGGIPIAGREGSILYSSEQMAGSLVLRGFTLQNGQAAHRDNTLEGGAIAWTYASYDEPFPNVDISYCTFSGNRPFDVRGLGTVMFVQGTGRISISSCSFAGNCCAHAGNALLFIGSVFSNLNLENCTFELESTGSNAVRAYSASGNATVSNCVFHADEPSQQYTSIWLIGFGAASILNNQFIDDGQAVAATSIGVGYQGIPDPPFPYQSVTMTGNLLWHSTYQGLGAPPTVAIACPNMYADVENNTFVGCGLGTDGGGTPILVRDNLFYASTAQLDNGSGGTAECNDAWPHPLDPPGGPFTLDNNIAADPVFCGVSSGDFRLSDNSPCAGANSPAGCGQIGALGTGCSLPIGACCLPDHSCQVTTSSGCALIRGIYEGDGGDCTPNPCQPIPIKIVTWGQVKNRFSSGEIKRRQADRVP